MKLVASKFYVAILIILALSVNLRSQTVNGVILSDTGNLTVVKVWGSHEERGFAYGYLLGDKISDMVEGYVKPIFGNYMDVARQMVMDGEDLTIDSIFVKEAQALVAGMDSAGTNTAEIDYIDGLVFNAFLDIAKLLGMKLDGPGCSSLMNWGEATANTDLDGKSVISRHLDWSPHPTLTANQVLTIHLPSESNEQPWVNIGFAGQMSTLSGFNSEVSVFQHMMSDFTASSVHGKGFEPVWLTLRKAIEMDDINGDGANNVQDLRFAIEKNQNGYADGYILTSLAPSSNQVDSLIALVAEVAPQAPYLTFRHNDYPDNIPGDNLYAANYEIKRNDHQHYCSRYYAIINALGNGINIGTDDNWSVMRDHSNGLQGNIQFMQVVPETGSFKLSVYQNYTPAYQNQPVEFEIDELFSPVTGTNYFQDEALVHLFPNPANDEIFIDIEDTNSSWSYYIFDLKGKIYKKGVFPGKSTSAVISDLKPGIYFMKLQSARKLFIKKFVKR